MLDPVALEALASLWQALPGLPGDGRLPEREVVVDGSPGLASAFEVEAACLAAIAAAGVSADADTSRPLIIDGARAAATLATVVEIDGEPVPKWATLSGYYRTADERAIQFHANFDHHAAGIVRRLGCDADRASVEAATAQWQSDELESALIADGMIAAKLRTLDEWARHPHAIACAGLPLVSFEPIGDAPPLERTVAGARVVDCSRVLAGPVAGQTLAGFGADVLRVGASYLPSVPVCVMATGGGKRTADLDLGGASGTEAFAGLLGGADVWLDAFRPGAFAGHGFPPERAAELSPGCVVVQLCAFDQVGPWAGRRGFDSIVQSTTGIVDAGSVAAGRVTVDEPTPLPVQALDYATGWIAAAAAARAMRMQAELGGSWLVQLSLQRTRNWLVSLGGPSTFTPAAVPIDRSVLHTADSDFGRLTTPQPVLGAEVSPPRLLGSDDPVWLSRT